MLYFFITTTPARAIVPIKEITTKDMSTLPVFGVTSFTGAAGAAPVDACEETFFATFTIAYSEKCSNSTTNFLVNNPENNYEKD